MALNNFGDVPANITLPIFWTSHDAATGANETMSGLATSDILIYKAGSTTQRSSTNGFTLLDTDGIDFDSLTGVNGVSIDLSDNTDAGFYAAGSFYNVIIGAITIDAQTVYVHAATFRIVAAEATAGTPETDVKTWNNLTTVALPLVPTVAGRTLDCSAGGEAGVDWANVGSPTTSLALTGTSIITTQKVDVDTIKTNPVVNGGTITFPTTATLASTTNITAGTIATVTNVTTVNGLAANVITAAAIADNAIDDAAIAADAKVSTSAIADAVLDDALLDSVPADGSLPTLRQAVYMLTQFLTERSVSGTTLTVKKVNGSTTLMTFTLDSSSAPTSITRTT